MDNNKGNLDLLTVGDASVDTFLTPAESEALCRIDTKECLIAFSYGDKIPVRSLEFSVGGNAANNAVGVKRLGINVGLVLTLGDDLVGNTIVEKLREEEVDLTYVIQQPETSSNYSTIINYSGERTILTYHAPRSYEFPVALPVTEWVYLTSMGETFRPFYNHFAAWIKKNPTIKLAFNPGTWQVKAPIDQIQDILSSTHLIFVNREEAEKLTNFGPSQDKEKDLLLAVSKLGPKISVVTDGPKGAFVYDLNSQKFFKIGILPVDAYERTGAGDAFGSGVLAGLIKGKSLEEALIWGTVNSASVIGYVGPQRGLLKLEEVGEWTQRAKSSGIKVGEF
ncbi:carbohydrate kinase family protein [Candidatus Woesebacteria bacterium]|nr:carbohydrate kinase family protein [Candidatus Woesebacteria bacterium]